MVNYVYQGWLLIIYFSKQFRATGGSCNTSLYLLNLLLIYLLVNCVKCAECLLFNNVQKDKWFVLAP